MGEIRTEVKTFRVDRECDKCGNGRMICIKPAVVDGKPRSKHQCSNDDCQDIQWIEGPHYPRIEHSPASAMDQISGAASTVKDKLKQAFKKLPATDTPKASTKKKLK